MSDAAPDGAPPDTGAPKRRGKVRKRHTIGKVVLASVLVMAMATGLGTIWLYRHLNGNLNVVDVTDARRVVLKVLDAASNRRAADASESALAVRW